MESTELAAGDLLLRPWRPEDAAAVHRACQDPDIQRWTRVPRPYRISDAEQFVGRHASAAWTAGTGAPFAVCDAATGELLGSCGLIDIATAVGSADIGYWTAPWARGRAVAVHAVRAVARWAFTDLGLRRLVWLAEIGNHASRLVALRAGFRIEGKLRLAERHPEGFDEGWVGTLLPADLAAADAAADSDAPFAGPAAPGTLVARRAAVFGRPQPTLFAATGAGELRLRPMEERDLDAIVIACRDATTLRWTTLPKPYGRSDAEGFLRYGRAAWAEGRAACFVIADPDDAYAGTIDLRLSPADPLNADVGFMTAPHARGRGYQPAALAALAAWGFTSLGLARVEWAANVGNTASRRVAEKAGFVFEGTRRAALTHRGDRIDVWVAALTAADLAGGRNG